MGHQVSEVGGGEATPLGKGLIDFLLPLIGAPGNMDRADPVGKTQGIAGVISDLFSPGAGVAGKNIQELIQQDITKQVGATRARFTAGGGVSRGTPAAYAESNIRATSAPRIAHEISSLQLSTLLPLLQIMSNLGSKGISQRETLVQDNPWLLALQGLSGAAQGVGAIGTGFSLGK